MSKLLDRGSVSLVFALGTIGGGGYWMARQEVMTNANASRIQTVESYTEKVDNALQAIDKRLTVIETLLRRKLRQDNQGE